MTIEATAARALASIGDADPTGLACIIWYSTPGAHRLADVAIVPVPAYLVWIEAPHTPPPRILWWTSGPSGEAGNIRRHLRIRGMRELGPMLPEDLAVPLRAHVRQPKPRTCNHCGAPLAGDVKACRFCGSPS